MHINWKIRLRNPVFWAEILLAVFAPLLAYFGLRFEDLTTWSAIGQLLLEAAQNPVIVVSVLVSVWNAVCDPTTAGISDSRRALHYEAPWSDKVGDA